MKKAEQFRDTLDGANPDEIRTRIWLLAAPSKAERIQCCAGARTSFRNARCIYPFSSLLIEIDSLHVVRHDPKLGVTNTTFFFCSISCFAQAVRLSNSLQRQMMSKGRVSVSFWCYIYNVYQVSDRCGQYSRFTIVQQPLRKVCAKKFGAAQDDEEEDGEG